jgi:hypothetical protein
MGTYHLSWLRLDDDNWRSACGRYHLQCQQTWVRGRRKERLFGARVIAEADSVPGNVENVEWLVKNVSMPKARRACRQHAAGETITQPKTRGRKKGFTHSEEVRAKMRAAHRFARDISSTEDRIVPVPSSPELAPGPLPREDLIDDVRRVVEIAATYVGGHIHEPTSLRAWTAWIEQIGREVEQHLHRLRTSPPRRRVEAA